MIDDIRAAEIAKMYYNKVRAHCLFIVGDEFETDDIVQNVFLLFEQKRKTLEDEYVKSWLYKATELLIKEFYRKKNGESKRTVAYTEYHAMISDIVESIDREIVDTPEELDRKIAIVMDSLTEKERKVIELCREGDKTYRQIGEELGIKEKDVNVTVCRARKKIRTVAKTLSPQWYMLVIKIYF